MKMMSVGGETGDQMTADIFLSSISNFKFQPTSFPATVTVSFLDNASKISMISMAPLALITLTATKATEHHQTSTSKLPATAELTTATYSASTVSSAAELPAVDKLHTVESIIAAMLTTVTSTVEFFTAPVANESPSLTTFVPFAAPTLLAPMAFKSPSMTTPLSALTNPVPILLSLLLLAPRTTALPTIVPMLDSFKLPVKTTNVLLQPSADYPPLRQSVRTSLLQRPRSQYPNSGTVLIMNSMTERGVQLSAIFNGAT